ncbi:MAG: hypothetical protein ACOYMB_01855 [Patescibacteria group bacterium]
MKKVLKYFLIVLVSALALVVIFFVYRKSSGYFDNYRLGYSLKTFDLSNVSGQYFFGVPCATDGRCVFLQKSGFGEVIIKSDKLSDFGFSEYRNTNAPNIDLSKILTTEEQEKFLSLVSRNKEMWYPNAFNPNPVWVRYFLKGKKIIESQQVVTDVMSNDRSMSYTGKGLRIEHGIAFLVLQEAEVAPFITNSHA